MKLVSNVSIAVATRDLPESFNLTISEVLSVLSIHLGVAAEKAANFMQELF